jgi:pimeloyl-ACP methyl ester carboxylesterase
MAKLTLDDSDPRVQAARQAEKKLFGYYGLKPKESFVLAGGVKTRLLEFGEGKPLLIVPGNTGDGYVFAALLPHLHGRRVILLNRPGGGLSEGMDHNSVSMRAFATQALTDVLDALSLDSVPVIAHSMGGHWSLWLCMDAPHRVSALGLLGVPGNVLGTRPPALLRLASRKPINRLILKLVTPKARGKALRGLVFMGHKKEFVSNLPVELAECYYRFQNLPHYPISSLSLMEQMSKEENSITAKQLQAIDKRVVMLWGENDTFGKADTGRAISEALCGSSFVPLAGCGHLPWLERPEECAKSLLRHFED